MKSYRVRYRTLAIRHIARIWKHIASDAGSSVADRFERRLFEYLDNFKTAPKRGTLRHRQRGIRTVGWQRTLTVAFIVNEPAAEVVILAVYYRGRDIEAALRRLPP